MSDTPIHTPTGTSTPATTTTTDDQDGAGFWVVLAIGTLLGVGLVSVRRSTEVRTRRWETETAAIENTGDGTARDMLGHARN